MTRRLVAACCTILCSVFAALAFAFTYDGVDGLAETSGNKFIEGKDNFDHLVYATEDGFNVKTVAYRTRPRGNNGIDWSAPVTLSLAGVPCDHPTVAVDVNGDLGVAFVCNTSEIFYVSLPYGGSWTSPPVKIDDGTRPTMVGYGPDVYLAWQEPPSASIKAISFPTQSPRVWTIGTDDYVALLAVCDGILIPTFPAIAVSHGAPGDPDPVVQVAYFRRYQLCDEMPPPTPVFGVRVARRPAGGCLGGCVGWDDVHGVERSDPNPDANYGGYGTSLSFDAGKNGDFLLAWSDTITEPFPNTTYPRTMLTKMKAATVSSPAVWEAAIDLQQANPTLVDVAHGATTSFIYVQTDTLTGDVERRAGSWPDSLSAPVLSAPFTLAPTSREPHAVVRFLDAALPPFWTTVFSATSRCPYVVWDRSTGPVTSVDQYPQCPVVVIGPSDCAVVEMRAVTQVGDSRAKCISKAVAKNAPISETCPLKAEAKFSKTFAKAAGHGDCPATIDGDLLLYETEGYVDALAGLLVSEPPAAPSKCTARKIKAAGKRAADVGKCHQKALKGGVTVDPTCLAKANEKFATAFAKAAAAGDCVSPADDAADVAGGIDYLIAASVCQIAPDRCP